MSNLLLFSLLAFLLLLNINAQTKQKAEQIGVGVYILNLGDENMSDGSFYADFVLHFLKNPKPNVTNTECPELKATYANNGKYRPVLVNGGRSGVLFNLTNSYRVQSRFYFKLNAAPWPYDTQVFDIVLELEDLPLTQAVFCFMKDYSGISPSIRFAGRNTEDFYYSYVLDIRDSPPFSISDQNGTYVSLSKFSRFSFQIYSTRPALKSFIKTMLPPIFICLVVLYTYLLPHTEAITRVSVLGSMLVAAVMFHVGLESGLPLSSTLNRADAFMICVYALILIAFIISMLILRLQKGKNKSTAQLIAAYAELPGIAGSPLIFIALAFESEKWWIVLLILIGAIIVLLFISFLYRRYVKNTVKSILGKAITDYKLEIVENVEGESWVNMGKKAGTTTGAGITSPPPAKEQLAPAVVHENEFEDAAPKRDPADLEHQGSSVYLPSLLSGSSSLSLRQPRGGSPAPPMRSPLMQQLQKRLSLTTGRATTVEVSPPLIPKTAAEKRADESDDELEIEQLNDDDFQPSEYTRK